MPKEKGSIRVAFVISSVTPFWIFTGHILEVVVEIVV
jgi:hypothetical protein